MHLCKSLRSKTHLSSGSVASLSLNVQTLDPQGCIFASYGQSCIIMMKGGEVNSAKFRCLNPRTGRRRLLPKARRFGGSAQGFWSFWHSRSDQPK